jgi:hypothetical protein
MEHINLFLEQNGQLLAISYAAIASFSLLTKVQLVKFSRDLAEVSRSRETKSECQEMEAGLKSSYWKSAFWPIELLRVLFSRSK